MAGPDAVHGADQLRHRASSRMWWSDYTSFARQSLRVAVPDRRVRALLQPRHVREGRHHRSAERPCPSSWRLAKELTVFNDDGSIKVAGFVPYMAYYETNVVTISIDVRSQLVQRGRNHLGRELGSRMAGHGQLAEGTGRFLRLRQPAAFRCGSGRRVGRGERLPHRAGGHDHRRGVADLGELPRNEEPGRELHDGSVPGSR